MTKDISRRGFLAQRRSRRGRRARPLSGTAAAHGATGTAGRRHPAGPHRHPALHRPRPAGRQRARPGRHVRGPARRRYAEVEVGGTYDSTNNVNNTAAQFRAVAERYDLKPEGMHNPGGHAAWRANPEAVLDDAKALGLRYVGVASPAGGTPQTHAAYAGLAEEFNAFGAAARRRG